MVLPAIATVVLVAVVSAVIGGLIVYLDTHRRNDDRGFFWTAITILGFIFGIIPGVVIILSYFVISRQF
jgi:ABC-type Fe3+ transport system permease subunit